MASSLSIRETFGAKIVGFVDQTLLDTAVIARVGQDLKALLHNAPPAIVLDFQRVSQMSSAALGALVGLYPRAAAAHCELVISGANPHITKLFSLTNLPGIFRTFETSEKALNYLRAGPLKDLLSRDATPNA
jgi:anti-anti-sigma factor